MEKLFIYGILKLEKTQRENYNRLLSGEEENLSGYLRDKVKIVDPEAIENKGKAVLPAAVFTGSPNDLLEGEICQLSRKELEQTDAFLAENFKRVPEEFSSGKKAWVYTAKKEASPSTIPENIERIRTRVNKACEYSGRNPEEVKILLATKTVPPVRIKKALECGVKLIAENKAQEVREKSEALSEIQHSQHFIGHLQRNKVNMLLRYDIDCIHSVDRWRLAEKLNQRLQVLNKTMDIFIQINTSNEESKFGLPPEKAVDFARKVAELPSLNIKGLMTIGLFTSDTLKIRRCFQRLKKVQEALKKAGIPGVEMNELSMGMSGDLEIAIEEGATIIRVGTAVFGKRKYPDTYYWDETQDSD